MLILITMDLDPKVKTGDKLKKNVRMIPAYFSFPDEFTNSAPVKAVAIWEK